MKISEINIYPIKSLRGKSVAEALVEKRGLRHDRRWMVTDREGMFLTQREVPKMALISVDVSDTGIVVGAPETEPLFIADGTKKDTVKSVRVQIWNSECRALVYPTQVNEWFSDVLGRNCQLVLMPESTERHVSERFDRGDNLVSFADGYPLLLIGEGSLAELNRRIVASAQHDLPPRPSATPPKQGGEQFEPLPMKRFRPNLVIAGSEPFEEDRWARIRVGEATFRVVKPCARCAITTVDPDRGEFAGKEPLRTLASFRMAKDVFPDKLEELGMEPNYVLFGENLIPENPGVVIRVGDKLEVLETRA
ncbi:MAG: MOSC domain-containing protein [Acidobacteria bacterium]|nr:MOSC domain-containing protein [Acidobacteriota bacterium]